MAKHASLLQTFMNYDHEKFYNIAHLMHLPNAKKADMSKTLTKVINF
jgi:hypothetical protein